MPPSTLCSHPLPAGIEQAAARAAEATAAGSAGAAMEAAARAAATQRLMQMRLAQAALMPDPHCLDAPPPDMMQLCDRKSVVQFINEVRASRPHPPQVS